MQLESDRETLEDLRIAAVARLILAERLFYTTSYASRVSKYSAVIQEVSC